MGYYTEISKSSAYSAQDTALYNRMNGVSGHSWLGATLAANTMNIFSMGVSLFDGSLSNNGDVTGPEPESDNNSIVERNNNLKNFNKALSAFNKTPSKTTAEALKKAYEAEPDNATIARCYKNCKEKVETYLA